MVFTIEPGLYLAEEGLGIRIEDDVLVTEDGYEVLPGISAPDDATDIAISEDGIVQARIAGEQDLREIGRELGVRYVVEGSVRKQDDRLRITAQLVDAGDNFHLWSDAYDRTMDDVLAIQDDISRNVADAMKIVLDDEAWRRMQAAGVRNVDAFVEYQKGREAFSEAHGSEDLLGLMRQSVGHFERAIELVPEFGAAYWQMSDYYGHIILDDNHLTLYTVDLEAGTVEAIATARWILYQGDTVTGSGPFTLVLRHTSGGWKIIHDHSSSDPAPPQPVE